MGSGHKKVLCDKVQNAAHYEKLPLYTLCNKQSKNTSSGLTNKDQIFAQGLEKILHGQQGQ